MIVIIIIAVKFIDRDNHWYTRKVREAIHIRLYPNNNRDNGIEFPEAWMPTIKRCNNKHADSWGKHNKQEQ